MTAENRFEIKNSKTCGVATLFNKAELKSFLKDITPIETNPSKALMLSKRKSEIINLLSDGAPTRSIWSLFSISYKK